MIYLKRSCTFYWKQSTWKAENMSSTQDMKQQMKHNLRIPQGEVFIEIGFFHQWKPSSTGFLHVNTAFKGCSPTLLTLKNIYMASLQRKFFDGFQSVQLGWNTLPNRKHSYGFSPVWGILTTGKKLRHWLVCITDWKRSRRKAECCQLIISFVPTNW